MKTLCLALAISVTFATAAEWKTGNGFRYIDLPKQEGQTTGFKLLSTAETSVAFTNTLSEESIAANRVLPNGSGIALGDFDGDGLPDIFACGLETPCKLFRNLGNFKFTDATAAANLPTNFQMARGAVFADINHDGQLDLLISTVSEGVRCFVNHDGKFIDATAASGLQHRSGSTTLALADINGDGALDLYVANYRTNDIRDVGRVSFKNVGGKPFIPPDQRTRFTLRRGQVAELGEPDQLYLNDGKGHFTPVSWTDGAFLDADGKPLKEPPLDWGLSATFRDINNDGAPDLYVCNDYWTPDRLWINDGKGHFRAAAPFTLRKIPSSSMGVDFADINRDGLIDFFAVEMLGSDPRTRKRQMLADKPELPSIGVNNDLPQVFQNTLFLGRADGTFAEVAYFAGLEASDWSWSPLFLDVDLDGYEDLLISAGHFHDVQDLDAQAEIRRRQHSWAAYTNEVARQTAYTKELQENYRLYPDLKLPIRAYRNGGDLHFHEMTGKWGFTTAAIHHGFAAADLDGDGDLDLVANCLNSALEIYRNDSDAGRVAVRFKNGGIGNKVVLRDATGVQSKEIFTGGAYLSGSQPLAVFALKQGANARLEITWRDGKTSLIRDTASNRLYEIAEAAETIALEPKTVPTPMFEEASDRLNHVHHETAFDDLQRQPTLPFKLSQQGPGVAWFDINHDGHDDLIIGAGAGDAPAVFQSDGKGKFTRATAANFPPTGDYLGLLGWKNNLLAAVSGYESPQKNPIAGINVTGLPQTFISVSVLALGTFAPPAGLALFVGGGPEPAKYPLATPSALLRLENGEWKYDARNSNLLGAIGIVNGALWTDLDSDGAPELVLACEWGSIRVFAIRNSLLHEITADLGLAEFTGLWKGVTTADVDGDGRLDIIAANWGLNSPFRATPEHPFTAFYGEMVQPGRIEFIETEWDATANAPTARRSLERLSSAMPFTLEQFRSFKDFAAAPIQNLLGERKVLAKEISVKTLASTVFLNRNGKFTPVELPTEAQFAPSFSVSAADFDGDGAIDLFLSQNQIAMHPDYSRCDAGRGLLLQGDGHGHFKSISGEQSGIKIYGEQRGAAVCDFDEDGCPDLVVTQNGAQTKLYRNASATPGLRVRLDGPPGAQLWVEQGQTKSPVQEIQIGSGYLSQDSPAKILPRLTGGTIKVRWPGGKISSHPIPQTGADVTLTAANTQQ